MSNQPINRLCCRCHTCGTPLRTVLDGEEWCPKCGAYRRYVSHGWSYFAADTDERAPACPEWVEETP